MKEEDIGKFILEIVSNKIGVRENENWIIYKTDLTNKKGKPRYLRVGIDSNTGAISAAHPFTKGGEKILKNNNYLGKYL